MGGGKTSRIAWYQKLIEDLDTHLPDENLGLRLRHRYAREVAQMLACLTPVPLAF
jgi:hypothetical protein